MFKKRKSYNTKLEEQLKSTPFYAFGIRSNFNECSIKSMPIDEILK